MRAYATGAAAGESLRLDGVRALRGGFERGTFPAPQSAEHFGERG